MTIGERIKYVRENVSDKKISMAAFGKKLSVSSAAVNQWEKNKNEVPLSIVKLISKQFEVNETWLLTGAGEMKAPKNREQELVEITAAFYNADPEGIQYKLMKRLSQLTPDQWQVIKDIIEGL